MRFRLHASLLFFLISCLLIPLSAQRPGYWQQRVRYDMDVKLDVETHRYDGTQRLTYFNNSPDTLRRFFYHLYFNAFQPGSQMDEKGRAMGARSNRIGDRIAKLDSSETGFLRVKSLAQNGEAIAYELVSTVLEVELAEPIAPGDSARFDMEFVGRVPKQTRRSGRDNAEGVDYSMTQWYPKAAEYDEQGWHADPYVSREFYGVWGDFDVEITLDSSYIVGGTGYLQNPEEVGHGYPHPGQPLQRPAGDNITYHFFAPNVHDFAWAADPDFRHEIVDGPDGLSIHLFYQPEASNPRAWSELPLYIVRFFEEANERFGAYPYEQFSVIQGGDAGMEYPMATLVTGQDDFYDFMGTVFHEGMHSWYYGVLANDEGNFPWLDEGFTSWAENELTAEIFGQSAAQLHRYAYVLYQDVVAERIEEPMTTHSDYYGKSLAYAVGSYYKGLIFLNQLGYLIGDEARDRALRRYYETWKFKHPKPFDFIRIAERESGLELDWYLEMWTQTTRVIDYGIAEVSEGENRDETVVVLERNGNLPMPVDLRVQYKDGSHEFYTIPTGIMRGAKTRDSRIDGEISVAADWLWPAVRYELILPRRIREVVRVEIDPSGRMADLDAENNIYPKKK